MDQLALQLMMLDIDGILTRYGATTADVLAAAQQMAVSAIGNLVNNGQCSARPKGACYQRDARMVNVQWSMVNVQWSMVNVQWPMVNVQWSMINVQWSMVNVQWSMFNGLPTPSPTRYAPPSTPASTRASDPTGSVKKPSSASPTPIDAHHTPPLMRINQKATIPVGSPSGQSSHHSRPFSGGPILII